MPSALPLANVFTLGVRDFGAERGFYRRLGWPLVLDRDDFVVFELRGALLALFPEDRGNGGIRCSIIISKEPTDAEFFDGRDAYFRDPKATSGKSRGHRPTTQWWWQLGESPASCRPPLGLARFGQSGALAALVVSPASSYDPSAS